MAILSNKVLHIISDNLCAKDLWNVLATNYSHISEARIMQLRYKFHNLNRSSKKIIDYLAEIKDVCVSLAAVGSPISNKKQVQHVLCSLRPKYNMFCIILQVQSILSCYNMRHKFLRNPPQILLILYYILTYL